MSPQSTPTSASRTSVSEPTELRLTRYRATSSPDGTERHLDQLLDILALDQVGELAASGPGLPSCAVLDSLQEQVAAELSRDTADANLSEPVEISVVIPCLGHAASIGNCVLKAVYAIEKLGVSGEVIVADAGSRDDSVDIAAALGARIVHSSGSGYGAALMAGLAAARGKYILTADGDDSYDLTLLPKFYDRLCDGADLVQGCRMAEGGGRIMPGALGRGEQFSNGILTHLARRLYRAPIHDVNCAMRAFRRELVNQLDLRCTGSEFTAEMLVKSAACGARISELPITYYQREAVLDPVGFQGNAGALRTLRYFSVQSLRATWLAPAALAGLAGVLVASLAVFGAHLGLPLGAGSLLVAMASILVGVQLATGAVVARLFAERTGLRPHQPQMRRLTRYLTFERCVFASAGLFLGGVTSIAFQAAGTLGSTSATGANLYQLIPAVAAVLAGMQLLTTSFLLGLIRMPKR
jgi:hypothetical protein